MIEVWSSRKKLYAGMPRDEPLEIITDIDVRYRIKLDGKTVYIVEPCHFSNYIYIRNTIFSVRPA